MSGLTTGAIILDPLGLRLGPEEKAFFRDADPFGFILFARNLDNADQIRALCNDLRDAVGREAPITIDQEGGRVQRLRAPDWTEWLPPLDHVARAGDYAAEAMFLRYRIIAHELRALGIDSNCAPLVDVAHDETHPFLKNRCYGTDPQTVAQLGRAVADGLLEGGVLPVVKHIPGHGRAVADSHLELPHVDAGVSELTRMDFAPFKALADLPLGMTAHLVYTQIDAQPATISSRMMQLIRSEIGFDGLIMTDDISMKALSGDLGALSAASRAAGCDLVLHCNGSLEEKRRVADAAGRLDANGARRAAAAIAARKTPAEVDIPAMQVKLDALLNG